MALSGTINGTTNNEYITPKIIWSATQSITGNYSTVKATLYYSRNNTGYTTYGTGTFGITINGTTKTETKSITITYNSNTIAVTNTVKVDHNNDGTKTITISASGGIPSTTFTSTSCSASVTLDTIPRATTPVLSTSSPTMGNSITITLNRASAAFTHNLTYSFGAASGTIATGAGTSASWTVPLDLANQIPNATYGAGTITCKTYNGTTLIGTKAVSFTASVPTSVIPTISAISDSETVVGLAAKFSAYVQHKSKIAISITAAGAYSSTISAYSTTIDGATYTGASFTSGAIGSSGSITISVTVTDSRGRKGTSTKTVNVLAYSPPTITAFSAYRCNADGTQNYDGARVNASYNFTISTVNNLNDKYFEIVYRQKGTSSWAAVTSSSSLYSANTNTISGEVFNVDYAYELTMSVYDYFDSDSIIIEVPTAFTLFDCRSTGKGIAFGKVSESDKMEIALDVDLTGTFEQEDRQVPTLLNSWVNYGTAYESATYWKDKCGVVHLAGMIKSGTTTAETVIFTLPEGYRPRTSEKFFAVSVNAICVIDVYSTGNVAIKSGANASWLSLSGISFRAAG